jgi:hypothetical protein
LKRMNEERRARGRNDPNQSAERDSADMSQSRNISVNRFIY